MSENLNPELLLRLLGSTFTLLVLEKLLQTNLTNFSLITTLPLEILSSELLVSFIHPVQPTLWKRSETHSH